MEHVQVVGMDFLHACMINWAFGDVASYLAVHELEINPLKGDLQETPLTRLHILHRELSSQFWTYTHTYNQKAKSGGSDALFMLETQQTQRFSNLMRPKYNQNVLYLADIATPVMHTAQWGW